MRLSFQLLKSFGGIEGPFSVNVEQAVDGREAVTSLFDFSPKMSRQQRRELVRKRLRKKVNSFLTNSRSGL